MVICQKKKKSSKSGNFTTSPSVYYPHNIGVNPELDQRTDHGKPHGSTVNNFVREVTCNFSPPQNDFFLINK